MIDFVILLVDVVVSAGLTYFICAYVIYPNLDRTTPVAFYIVTVIMVFLIIAAFIGTGLFTLFT
jgi:hypothetical protein